MQHPHAAENYCRTFTPVNKLYFLRRASPRGKLKWFTEFGHLNRGDMLTSEQHRCHNEKKKFQRR
ncbi:hypothetical protein MTQ55_08025, partial [Escherichia coli]|nr:hypothetical protein [Escherichia coli]